MDTEQLLVGRSRPSLHCAGCLEQLESALAKECHRLHVVGVIAIGDAQCRNAPRVLELWVELDAVRRDRKRRAVTEYIHAVGEVVPNGSRELDAPLSAVRRHRRERGVDRAERTESTVHAAATVKA